MASIELVAIETANAVKLYSQESMARMGVSFPDMDRRCAVVTFRLVGAGQISLFNIWIYKDEAPEDQWVSIARAKLRAVIAEIHGDASP